MSAGNKDSKRAARKGNLLEEIAAKLHTSPGVKVERRVMLPPVNERFVKKREIDVLITASVLGYSVQMAIECKNESRTIEPEYVDAFVGKLQYVGIPVRHGIFVSRSAYSQGAKERANEAGITLLNVVGLTEDGLSEAVFKAFQSVIYLLLEVKELRLTNSNPGGATDPQHEVPIFYNTSGKSVGTLYDPLWKMWREGEIPLSIGEHEVNVSIPKGWVQFMPRQNENSEAVLEVDPLVTLSAQVAIVALVIGIPGKAKSLGLRSATEGSIEKAHMSVVWDDPNATVYLTEARTEDQLDQSLIEQREGNITHLTVGRIRLPRIRAFGQFGYFYWPPSESALVKMLGLAQRFGLDKDRSAEVPPDAINPYEIEGTDFGTIWEPVYEGYPFDPA